VNRRCPVCDQPLLEDETVCWHCGHAAGQASPAAATAPPAGPRRATAEADVRLSPKLFYGVLTAVIIAAALYLTAFLGRQPLAHGSRTDLPAGWVWLTSGQNDFTFFVPATWEVRQAMGDEETATLTALVHTTDGLARALQPLSRLDYQLRVTLYARGPLPVEQTEPGFVLVARSRALNKLAAGDLVNLAVTAAEELGVTLAAAGEVVLFDQRYVYVDAITIVGEQRQRCQQQLFHGTEEMLWITACGPPEDRFQRDLAAILGSFQRLQS
jgi:hypothetical protein